MWRHCRATLSNWRLAPVAPIAAGATVRNAPVFNNFFINNQPRNVVTPAA
jgi:hypothetical protein